MEEYSFEKTETGLHVPGFPNAEKFIIIDDPIAHRLSDLYLHKVDLEFALECLKRIDQSNDRFVKNALYFSAIIYFYKCFTHSDARSQLPFEKVLKDEPLGLECYNTYKNFRDMHIVHDSNNISQCHTVAVLNKKDADYKIEKILCPLMVAEILQEEHFKNMWLLIEKSLNWVVQEFDMLADKLTVKLEQLPYETLLNMPAVQLNKPEIGDVSKIRHERFKKAKKS